MEQQIENFNIRCGNVDLRGQRWSCKNPKKTVLIMHGAGTSSSKDFYNLQTYLHNHNYESITFDFLGHGNTGGKLKNSSLERRTEQALAVVHKFNLHTDLNIIGFSMGAHNALHIAAQASANRLGLAIPAVYSEKAEKLKFGPSFSSCIRRHRSWEDSKCFSIIEKFKGKLLIISAENDSVIPAEIPCKLIERARNCLNAEHHCIRHADHDLGSHFSKDPQSRHLTLNSILRWLT
ncbi:alpha/beta hydrolase [Pseudomonas sp. S2_H10]|jgi:alpha-beta hydrolase superfamily lysophospholipase